MEEKKNTTLYKTYDFNFTHLPNKILRDKNLSWKARGLLCTMLSYATIKGWKFNRKHLISLSKDSFVTASPSIFFNASSNIFSNPSFFYKLPFIYLI